MLTRHQDTTEAITPDGKYVQIPLIRGEYKKQPNNPRRPDGTVFAYCPPMFVAEEMDKLVGLHDELVRKKTHVVIRSAYFHHAFSTIHPFQDGNGRVARILASMILIKEGYFPFTVTRENRKRYIQSLEKADAGSYQPLADLFSDIQIRAMKQALDAKEAK